MKPIDRLVRARARNDYLFRVQMREKKRLDQLLVERGLFDSRARAGASIVAGAVLVGPGRERGSKPGMRVDPEVEISVVGAPRCASRGGLKLERALETFEIDVTGRNCLDVGASTGGFTDCLLQAGANRVVAVDVAYGELDWRLRNDSRVVVLERKNARELEPAELPYPPDLIAVDVSFIGLAKVLPALAACAAPRFDMLALVKPQFEAGRASVGKGGVVRDPADRFGALVSVGAMARSLGLSVLGFCSSGLPGPAGNRESFIWCAEQSRGGVGDLRSAALQAEPQAAITPAEPA
jgi:23S rRNA (cytidine1920-2'-O)/16S rRNA (cytidine1409-2'-O)-methyltransferase